MDIESIRHKGSLFTIVQIKIIRTLEQMAVSVYIFDCLAFLFTAADMKDPGTIHTKDPI